MNRLKVRLNSIFGSIELFVGALFILSAYLYTKTVYLREFLPSEPFRTFIPFIFIIFGAALTLSGIFLIALES